MVFSNLLLAGRNLTRRLWSKASSLCRHAAFGFNWFAHNFSDLVKKALKFFLRPGVIGVVAFAVALGVLLGLGFGTAGIAACSAAAAFQFFAYGAFTPAGGIFPGLTSIVMTGCTLLLLWFLLLLLEWLLRLS